MATLDTIKVSKNNSDLWASLNPILANKEIGVEKDTNLFKVGDGVNHWAQLAYVVSGNQNAQFVFLSGEGENVLSLTSDGGIILRNTEFLGIEDYVRGKSQGRGAYIPQKNYNYTVMRIGQDVGEVVQSIVELKNRLTSAEARERGDSIEDTYQSENYAWSSAKIVDHVLVQLNAFRADITSNPTGAYNALVSLAQLLQDNNSIALSIATELEGTVKYRTLQTLTSNEKDQARQNIGALGLYAVEGLSDLMNTYSEAVEDTGNSQFNNTEL